MTATAETHAESGPECACALPRALLADDWSYTREVRAELEWHCQVHELESHDACLEIEVSVYLDGRVTAKLSAASAHGRPGWTADIEAPVPIALAAVKAAPNPPEPDLDDAAHRAGTLGQDAGPHVIAAMLTAEGWEVETEPEEDRDGRVTEIEWVSPDGERSACWNDKDAFGPGGWTITRSRRDEHDRRAAETYASPCAPPAVIAALALAD